MHGIKEGYFDIRYSVFDIQSSVWCLEMLRSRVLSFTGTAALSCPSPDVTGLGLEKWGRSPFY